MLPITLAKRWSASLAREWLIAVAAVLVLVACSPQAAAPGAPPAVPVHILKVEPKSVPIECSARPLMPDTGATTLV